MTCKECIHFNACKSMLEIQGFSVADDHSYGEGRVCEDFMDKSNWVEVHCADCENWGGVTLGNTCRHWSTMDCRVCTKPTDFCSYGKRKTE